MRTSPLPFSLSGIAVISGIFAGAADCAKLRVPPRAVMPAVAQAAKPRKRRRLWSVVSSRLVMAALLIKGSCQCLSGAGAGERRRYPPFLAACGCDVFGPTQIHRRNKIVRQQRRHRFGAANAAAGTFVELRLGAFEHFGMRMKIEK